MTEVIVLSDSDDEFEIPKKKLKANTEDVCIKDDNCFSLLDEDGDNEKENEEIKHNNFIKINISEDKMVMTIEKNGEQLLSDSKTLTHNVEDVEVENNIVNSHIEAEEPAIEMDEYHSQCNPQFETVLLETHTSDTLVNENVKPIESDIEGFIIQCENLISEQLKDIFQRKITSLRKLSKRATDYIKTDQFKAFLKQNLDQMISMPNNTVECFVNVYNEVNIAALNKTSHVNVTKKEDKYVRVIEESLRAIHKKIRKLEVKEVDFNDENDSVYIQYSRYKERATKLYEKYCKILKIDPHAGQITYNRLDFAKSNYNEFNKALNKKYKNNKKFPVFSEVDKVIRDCIKENNMDLTENVICTEIQMCFEEIGNLMQKRRQMELHIIHSSYLNDNHARDPAETDMELKMKLDRNKSQAKKKLNELCQAYVIKQEKGEEVEISEDTDDSNQVLSDED